MQPLRYPDDAPLSIPSRIVAATWLALGGLIVLATLGWGTFSVIGLLSHEESTRIDVVRDPVDVIDIDSAGGAIEVVGSSRADIRLRARVSNGYRPTRYRRQVEGDQLRVHVGCPLLTTWCSVKLQIEVPARLTVVVHSSHDHITLRGLLGRVDASTDNGSIDASGLAGDLTLRSDNGAVRGQDLRSPTVDASSDNGSVRLILLEDPTAISARSDNGEVEVAVPDDEGSYRVDASSDNGSVTNDVRTAITSTRTITARSSNGSVTVRYLR